MAVSDPDEGTARTMGRHDVLMPTRAVRPRRRRRRATLITAIVATIALVGLAIGLGINYFSTQSGASDCDNPTQVTIAAAPEIAPVITEVADNLAASDDDPCYRIDLVARDSANATDWLAESADQERPDVWIPDSTLWLNRAREKGATFVPPTATSLASTPVVLAVAEGAAIQRGWPQKQLNWSTVINPNAGNLAMGMPDPSVDAVGISALIAVSTIASATADPAAATISMLRKVSSNTPAGGASELYDRLLSTNQGGGSAGKQELAAFPTTESALLRHNSKTPNAPLVAVYPEPAVPSLDFPYAVLSTQPDRAVADAVGRFRTALLSTGAAGVLATNGLRSPDGRILGDPPPDDRTAIRHLRPVPSPEKATLDKLLNTWAGVTRSSRVLSILDISGSMNAEVPGTGGKKRMEIAAEANAQGVALFNPRTKLTTWVFSTKLDGDRDYREIVPVGTISDLLANGLQNTLRGIRAKEGGQTGLYDTTLAAYQTARQVWEPGRLNVIVITTDGRNDDDKTITRQELLAELATLQDPARPLPIVMIGIGPDIDPRELEQIASATKGVSFTTADPAKIGDIYFTALSRIMCKENCN
jgi:hypothetical protein